jgi:hypothetical protein
MVGDGVDSSWAKPQRCGRPSRSTVKADSHAPIPKQARSSQQIPHHAPSARSASLPSACRLCRRRHPGLWGKTRKNPARHRCRKGPLKPTSALSSGAHSPAFQDRRQPLPEAEPGPRPACLANHRACFLTKKNPCPHGSIPRAALFPFWAAIRSHREVSWKFLSSNHRVKLANLTLQFATTQSATQDADFRLHDRDPMHG